MKKFNPSGYINFLYAKGISKKEKFNLLLFRYSLYAFSILNPLDIDIKLFLKNLSKDKDIRNSVIFIKLSVQLLKLKVNNFLSLISTEGKEKKDNQNTSGKKNFWDLKRRNRSKWRDFKPPNGRKHKRKT